MQRKLQKAYEDGFEAGKKEQQELIELRGMVKGASETWDLMEQMFLEIDGVGPKTKEKILAAIKQYAQKEKAKLERELKINGKQTSGDLPGMSQNTKKS